MKQQILPKGEGRNYDWSNDQLFVKAGQGLSEGRVTVLEDRLKPGFHLPRHHHRIMTEIFYILEGEVMFEFEDEMLTSTVGTTINIPPKVWHEVRCEKGGKLLTVFSPGGFERYLEELTGLTAEQFTDEPFMTALAEKYDTWMR